MADTVATAKEAEDPKPAPIGSSKSYVIVKLHFLKNDTKFCLINEALPVLFYRDNLNVYLSHSNEQFTFISLQKKTYLISWQHQLIFITYNSWKFFLPQGKYLGESCFIV